MDDLTQCLYKFLMKRRMGYLWEDEEYRACISGTALQEERMRSCLNEVQQKELDLLLDRVSERDSLEKANLFRSAFGLIRELNALTR